jgi:UDP-N-acetylmuramoyl-tripeptide--D-alanyl-D-alanine ligase
MISLWTSTDAVRATHGRTTAPFTASAVSIDSRTVELGDLFVALKGPQHDGHDHVATALARGAAAAMVSHVPAGLPANAPLLVVDDTLAALEALGRFARARSRARVAAVTGSVGKTSTKEALRLALDAASGSQTHASAASFNNHIGVPLTLARLPADAAYAVFEIGMNHSGEISPLTRMVRPAVAIVTNVEGVHTQNFTDGLAGVAAAKAEIFDGFEGSRVATAVLNRDNLFFDFLSQRARRQGAQHVTSFGADPAADFRLLDMQAEATASVVTISARGRQLQYRIGTAGRHWALNTLGVLAVVEALGADIASASQAFASVTAPKGRGQRHRLPINGGTYELIDDSYNASPASMRASFEVVRTAVPGNGGRRIAVLGDMLELGTQAPELHAGLAEPLLAARVDLVFTCGANMRRLHDALPANRRGAHTTASDALLPLVREALRAGDVVVVKGSLGSRMGRIVDSLLTDPFRNGNGNGHPPRRVANG